MPAINAIDESVSARAVRKAMPNLPESAQRKFKTLKRAHERIDAESDARWARQQDLIKRRGVASQGLKTAEREYAQGIHKKTETFTNRHGEETTREVNDDSYIVEWQETFDEIKAELAKLQEDARLPSGLPNVDAIEKYIVKNPKKKFREVAVKLPTQSIEKDIALVESTRGLIAAAEGDAKAVDTAQLPVAFAEKTILDFISNAAAAGAPDFHDVLRTPTGISGLRKPGKPKFPTHRIAGVETYDAFHFACWLMKDELIKRAKAELAKQARPESAIPLEERPVLKAKIEAEILRLRRVEEALIERLHAAGRTDIARVDAYKMPPEVFLGIELA